MDRWKDRLYRFFCKELRREADAEELAAETFVRVWKGLRDLADPSLFRFWLFRIAWNVLRTHLRDRMVREGRVSLLGLEILDQRANGPDPGTAHDFRETLAALPGPAEAILRDKYERGLSYSEIAAREDVSIWVVKDRLRAAREALEKLLARRGLLDADGNVGGPAAVDPEAPRAL